MLLMTFKGQQNKREGKWSMRDLLQIYLTIKLLCRCKWIMKIILNTSSQIRGPNTSHPREVKIWYEWIMLTTFPIAKPTYSVFNRRLQWETSTGGLQVVSVCRHVGTYSSMFEALCWRIGMSACTWQILFIWKSCTCHLISCSFLYNANKAQSCILLRNIKIKYGHLL